MALRLYSSSLLAATIPGGDDAIYDVTDGFVVVVRDLSGTLDTNEGSGAVFIIDLNGVPFYRLVAPASFEGTYHWEGRLVAPGPSTITATLSGVSCIANLCMSGYVLTLP